MSYRSLTEYGYGIVFDDIPAEDITLEKIKSLIDLAPQVKARLEAEYGSDPTLEDYEDFGIAVLFADVLTVCENVPFYADIDEDDVSYVLLTPKFPWKQWKREKSLTMEDVDNMLFKYVKLLTDREIEHEFQIVVCGG